MGYIDVFESLSSELVGEFIALGQEEGLHLDFKTIRDAALTSGDDRRNFAVALSGFANSAGGLIIWGVEARKNAEGIDCAVASQAITNPRVLLSRLNSLTGDALDPIADGVEHRIVELDDGTGYAATIVPESDRGPHMAKLGENRYYKRAGDGFYRMEHYDIADMFGRRRRPKLEIFYRVVGRFHVHVGLRNTGRATARAPYFAFSCNGPMHRSHYGLDGNGNEGLKWLRASSLNLQWAYGGGMDFALHPGMAQEIAALHLGIPQREDPTEDLEVRFAVASDECALEFSRIVIPLGELVLGAA